MVSDKTTHKAFRTRTTLIKQKPIREIVNFHYLPKLYIGFNYFSLFYDLISALILSSVNVHSHPVWGKINVNKCPFLSGNYNYSPRCFGRTPVQIRKVVL